MKIIVSKLHLYLQIIITFYFNVSIIYVLNKIYYFVLAGVSTSSSDLVKVKNYTKK